MDSDEMSWHITSDKWNWLEWKCSADELSKGNWEDIPEDVIKMLSMLFELGKEYPERRENLLFVIKRMVSPTQLFSRNIFREYTDDVHYGIWIKEEGLATKRINDKQITDEKIEEWINIKVRKNEKKIR